MNFVVGWDLLVSLIKSWVFSVTVPKKENVINETFPLVFLRWIFAKTLMFFFFFAQCNPTGLKISVSIELK